MPCGVATRHSCSCEGDEEKNRSREEDSEESSDEEATCHLAYMEFVSSVFIIECNDYKTIIMTIYRRAT